MVKTTTNYKSEILRIFPPEEILRFPTNHNLLNDPNTVITTIECDPYQVLFKVSNGFKSTTIPKDRAYEFIQFYTAASTLTIKSLFLNPVMFPDYIQSAVRIMTPRFWSSCEQVIFLGLWHHDVVTSIAATFSGHLRDLIFRQCTVAGPFRLQRMIKRQMTGLEYINFDCRLSDNKDFLKQY
uniref:Uncharacterized protein n=1 Tax=Panagrolaimus superbus TaxID=310955 RepID=A0A914YNP2_9BILA